MNTVIICRKSCTAWLTCLGSKAAYCFSLVLSTKVIVLIPTAWNRTYQTAACRPSPAPCLFLCCLRAKNGLYIF